MTARPVPRPLTEEERQRARSKANAARQERAELKNRLRDGSLSLDQVLYQEAQKEAISRLKVIDLLRVLPGIGYKRAESIMQELSIALSRRLRGLGVHQKAALIDYLHRRSSHIRE